MKLQTRLFLRIPGSPGPPLPLQRCPGLSHPPLLRSRCPGGCLFTRRILRWHSGEEPACSVRDAGSILGREDPLEEGMATHSSVLAWRAPWTKEPGGLQSLGLQRVRQD